MLTILWLCNADIVASIDDVVLAFKVMFSWYGTYSHLNAPKRMTALSLGFLSAVSKLLI